MTDNLLSKIQALLDKAAATSFPAEAEAFQQKAEELMAKYSVEQAMLDQKAQQDGALAEEIITLYFNIQGTYAHGVLQALNTALNSLRTVTTFFVDHGRSSKTLAIVGSRSDADAALAMAKSLHDQALHAMKAWAKGKREEFRYLTAMQQFKEKRTFVTYFGYGVAGRLKLRFQEAVSATVGAELVLVDRQAAVQKYAYDKYNLRTTTNRTKSGSFGAADAGIAAGKVANLGDQSLRNTGQLAR
jgi:hypothetical protein